MKVYKIKEEITLDQLTDYGFKAVEISDEGTFCFCFVPQPFDGDLAQSVIRIYNDPLWQEKYYIGNNKKTLKRKMGLVIRNKKALITDTLKHNVTMWRVQFDMNEKMIGLVSPCPFDMAFFPNKEVIDKYCDKIIEELKEKNMVEEVEYKA